MYREELWDKLRSQVEKGSFKAHVTLAKLIELERVAESGDEAGIQIPTGCQVINRIPKPFGYSGSVDANGAVRKSMSDAMKWYQECK